jgi:histidinol-phosphate/aromatic aminotransferase/cobyric acid decarboxylase-like protein
MIPPPGPHGGDGAAIAAALGLDPASVLDLSASLNPWAPPVAELLAKRADAVGRYPDPRPATDALAAELDVDPARLLLTNGGSEAIALAARELGGRVAREPEFSLHPRTGTGPVWRSDPHNPSGALARADEVAGVWDEAFYPLATGRWTAGRDAVVVGSLTKVYACPGLRLGYVLADDVGRFARHQPGWPVSTVALAVLEDLVALTELERWAAEVAAARDALVALLVSYGLAADAADAPWVLVQAPGLRERLAPHGVVVRDCTTFGLPGVARVAVPDDDGRARLALALDRSAS